VFDQPIGQAMQVARKGTELPDRSLAPIFGDRYPMKSGPDVNAGGVEVDPFQNGSGCFGLALCLVVVVFAIPTG
jgi:hypothetical protein